MRISSIEIKNYRQYKYLKLDFEKRSKNDLHIIIADNGVGKTNILNAITWCLYEDESHLGNASKEKTLPRIDIFSLKEAKAKGEKAINVEVAIMAEDSGSFIKFLRTQEFKIIDDEPGFFEKEAILKVFTYDENNDAVMYDGEDAEEYVNKYMPIHIKQFFYFDGEQLDGYFKTEDNNQIKATIHGISQVDVLTRMKERIRKIERKKEKEAGNKNPNIESINVKIKDYEEKSESTKNIIKELEVQIKKSKEIIDKNTEQLKGQENLPDLENKYENLKNDYKKFLSEKTEAHNALYRFVRNYKIALIMYPAAKYTLDIIREKEEKHALPPNVDKKLLENIVKSHKCSICGHELTDKEEQNIKHIIDQIQVSSKTSNRLMYIRNELERTISMAKQYRLERRKYLDRVKIADENVDQCEKRLEEYNKLIEGFSDKEKIKQLHFEREKHEKLLKENYSKLAEQNLHYDDLKIKLEQSRKDLSLELDKAKECEKLNCMIKFLSKSYSIVKHIESQMMNNVREKMQKRTTAIFSDLIWKKGVYDHIALGTNYQLDLIHRDGYSCVGSISAAERSLLALAFTLALHEVSGFNALLFIDTPVARVTGENRKNFAKVLKEVSEKKQLIMTFTPDEYSENISDTFNPIASSITHLTMNTENEVTTVNK